MAKVIIPFKEFALWETEITLDDIPYIIIFKWNSRGGFWTMTWLDRNRVTLVSALKIIINYELIGWYPDRGLPPGAMYAVDERGGTERIGRDDFTNGRCSLIYQTVDEL